MSRISSTYWPCRLTNGGDFITKNIRINTKIRASEVRLVDADGKQLGVMPIRAALQAAAERDLDLVEVSPNSKPPVCKILDFGKYKYQMSKRQAAGKGQEMKEIKMRPRIGQHDLDRKVRNMMKFLDEGHKTKVSMFFRGRERGRPDLGMAVFTQIVETIGDKYNIVARPKHEGNNITMVVAPK